MKVDSEATNLILLPDSALMLSGVLDNTELVVTDHILSV